MNTSAKIDYTIRLKIKLGKYVVNYQITVIAKFGWKRSNVLFRTSTFSNKAQNVLLDGWSEMQP